MMKRPKKNGGEEKSLQFKFVLSVHVVDDAHTILTTNLPADPSLVFFFFLACRVRSQVGLLARMKDYHQETGIDLRPSHLFKYA